jgi:hypothetical protein
MRLAELNPRWGIDADIVIGGTSQRFDNRTGMAVTFDCPCCRKTRLAVWFANPVDGGPPTDDATNLWQRAGDTFDSLTLTPSVDASEHGHWHGFVTNGDCL